MLLKFDSLTISEEANQVNQGISALLLSRQESGIYQSLQELVDSCLENHPDEDRTAQVLVQLAERLFLQAVSSPLTVHTQLANSLLVSILQSTEASYHSALA